MRVQPPRDYGRGGDGTPLDAMFAVGAGADSEYPLRGHDMKDGGVLGVSPISRSLLLLNLEWRQRLFSRFGVQVAAAGFTDVARPSRAVQGDFGVMTDAGIGLRLAAGGLLLAALFLGWGLAGHFHHQAHVRARAREFADEWLRVLSFGDLPRAYQLHLAREYRQDPHSQSIKSRPTTSGEPDLEIDEFFSDPAVQKFLAAGPEVRFRFEETVHQSGDSLADLVVLKYTFDTKEGPIPLWLTIRRTFSSAVRARLLEMPTMLLTPCRSAILMRRLARRDSVQAPPPCT